MGSSLQEQFLKMGLVDKAKVNTIKKEKHDTKKSGVKQDLSTDISSMTKQALAEKKKRDQQLNKKKIAEREEKEATAKARQLIETHKIDIEEGNVAYNFKDNNTIKKLFLNEKTINRLAKGKTGIVKLAGEYQLVPADIVFKIKELNKNMIILFNTPSVKKETEEDNPYAEFEVPDDLMW